ncbi:MAG: leucine-rich repeat domain-containing protein [Chitinophagales bacterium]
MIERLLRKRIFITALCLLTLPPAFAQEDASMQLDPRELDEYKENAGYFIGVLQQYFNIVGDSSAPFSEKKVIFTESWQKLFRDSKVQVEDDLDPGRSHIIYKDITAYLKDIDFFFQHAEFNFEVKEIMPLINDEGHLFLKVDLHQRLNAIDIDGDTIRKEGERFVEISVNRQEQDLKIVSIYSNKISEDVNLLKWWQNLSGNWQAFFAKKVLLSDSLYLFDVLKDKDSIDFTNDFLHIAQAKDTSSKSDTLYFTDDKVLNQIRRITLSESLSISGDSSLRNLNALHVFSNLRQLDISHTKIQDLSPIRHFTDLRYLNASYSLVYDISPLQYNSGLKYLDLSFTLIEKLDVLYRFINLELLNLSNTRPQSLKGIENLSALKELGLANMQLEQVEYQRLQHLKALDYLKLSHSNIQDLSPLSNLQNLTRLDIRNTEISDITPLSSCDALKIINLEGAPLSSLLPLLVLPDIKKIYCDNTRISKKLAYDFMSKRPGTLVVHNSKYLFNWWQSLSEEWKSILAPQYNSKLDKEALQEIASQGKIDISGRKDIHSIEAVAILENLTYLDISNTSVEDITPLSDLRNLKYIDISNTSVNSLVPLILCSKLITLKMESTPVRSLTPLKSIPELAAIYADSSAVDPQSFDSLVFRNESLVIIHKTAYYMEWWNNLEQDWKHILADPIDVPLEPGKLQLHRIIHQKTLTITGNRKITYLEPLKKLRYLKELHISETGVSDLSPLKKLIYLEKLSITDGPLKNLIGIEPLINLEHLNISNTPVDDLEPIEALPTLKVLKLQGTAVRNLKSLSGLQSLEVLDCSNTNIRNLRHIEGLPNLKTITCYNTRISDRYIESFKAERYGVKVVYY